MKKFFTKGFLFTIIFLGMRLLAIAATGSVKHNCAASIDVAEIVLVSGKNNVQGNKDLKQATLNAYPNPSRGLTTIVLTQTGGENYKVRVSNAIGKVVKTIAVENAYEGTEIQVDLSDQPSGFYFYSLLINDKMVETKRLVLQQ